MTKEEILKMEAGGEMNLLVHTEIMKFEYGPDFTGDPHNWTKSYSTSISAAFEIVDKLDACLHMTQYGPNGIWTVLFCGGSDIRAEGETAPLAICRAGLLAVMEEK